MCIYFSKNRKAESSSKRTIPGIDAVYYKIHHRRAALKLLRAINVRKFFKSVVALLLFAFRILKEFNFVKITVKKVRRVKLVIWDNGLKAFIAVYPY
jgi:hypothetical protein